MKQDIEVPCIYAYMRWRFVILNTNGMAAPELSDRLLFADLRVNVPTLDARGMEEMTGRAGRGSVRAGMLTAISPMLIGKLEQFALFLQKRPWVRWIPLRLESGPDDPRPMTRGQVSASESLDAVRCCPEIRPYLTHEALPPECRRCGHLDRCLGGRIRPEALVDHDGGRVDSLAGFFGD